MFVQFGKINPLLILSYLILSYLILSYLILSYLILSYLILSYLILSYLILSYLILYVTTNPTVVLSSHNVLDLLLILSNSMSSCCSSQWISALPQLTEVYKLLAINGAGYL